MKSVPKPDGFDLRMARAEKADDGSKWLSHDAMYDASQQMQTDQPAVAFLVAWYSRAPNGKLVLKYRCSFEHERQAVALAADLLKDLQS